MKGLVVKKGWVVFIALVFIAVAAGGVWAAGTVTSSKGVTVFTPTGKAAGAIDFKNAKPMPLPQATTEPVSPWENAAPAANMGTPGFSPGNLGSSKKAIPSILFDAADEVDSQFEDPIGPQEYGTSSHVFTTSRVDLSTNNESKVYPYRAAGKLYFKIGTSTYVCSASLIKRGIIVTAAHCVANFGQSQFYSGWTFIPALSGTTAPYGQFTVAQARVLTSYYNGTDSCYNSGVVCTNDVAVLVANKNTSGYYPGSYTGWLGYAWNGYGFATFNSAKVAQISQLGYPVSHDGGIKMQRTDSMGYVNTTMSGNTVWGSRQTGGSSGGPEVVNLGVAASLSGTTYGSDATYNLVVGVTSWGYTSTAVKEQGASPFTNGNIANLVNLSCAAVPAACQ